MFLKNCKSFWNAVLFSHSSDDIRDVLYSSVIDHQPAVTFNFSFKLLHYKPRSSSFVKKISMFYELCYCTKRKEQVPSWCGLSTNNLSFLFSDLEFNIWGATVNVFIFMVLGGPASSQLFSHSTFFFLKSGLLKYNLHTTKLLFLVYGSMSFERCTHYIIHITLQDIEKFHHPHKAHSSPFAVNPSQCLGNNWSVFFPSIILAFPECPINGSISMYFWVYIFHLE